MIIRCFNDSLTYIVDLHARMLYLFVIIHDRPVGSDISQGQQVLSPGMKIRAAEVGILATVGVTEVKCYQTPSVGVMSTGNEVC